MRYILSLVFWLTTSNFASGVIHHNQFALFIPSGAPTANNLASKHGFVNLGQIGSLDNYYLFENPRLQRRAAEPSADHTAMLLAEPEVEWAEQMVERQRFKRDTTDFWADMFNPDDDAEPLIRNPRQQSLGSQGAEGPQAQNPQTTNRTKRARQTATPTPRVP